MKNLFSLLTLMIVATGLWAQPTSSDFWIHGTVTNATTNVAIPNHKMIIYEPAENNLPMLLDSTYTDANGYYSYVIWDGSLIAPNRNYYVQTYNCQNSAETQHLMNNQGTTDIGIANFSICDNSTACQAGFTTQPQNNNPLGIYFLSTATAGAGTITGWTWTFGDGTSVSNQPNISTYHLYSAPGTYTVCLTITTSEGCTSTYCSSVTVQPACTANYTVLYNNNGYLSLEGTISGGTGPYTFEYNFGDGNGYGLFSGPNAQYNYQNTGTYNVCFRVTSANGCVAEYCQQIVIGGSCTTSFTATSNDSTALFNPTSTGLSPFTLSWHYGDGETGTSPTHTYQYPGVYHVCLYSTDATGCLATYCQDVTITMPCVAGFSVQSNPNDLNVYFIGTFNGTINNQATYAWDFGDGQTGNVGPTEPHDYVNAGIYTVCVTVTADGCSDTYCQQITVGTPPPCDASFSYGSNLLNTVQFSPIYTAGVSNLWTFGDGTSSTNVDPVHVYANPGTYTVCHTVFNNNGCQDTDCQVIVVGNNTNCTGTLAVNLVSGTTFSFTAQTSGSVVDHYTYNFGDGGNQTTTDNPINHTFTAPGVYTVCVYITDVNGCVASACQQVTVTTGNACQAYFYGVGFSNPADQAIQFTDYSVSGDSLNPIIGWTWSFGDGTSSNDQNPMHDYVIAGTYYVCLTVWNNSGCQSQYCDSIVAGSTGSNNIISGTVYTSVNTPASVAYVFPLRFDYPNSALVPEGADVTSNGGYLFTNVPNGDYVVKAALTPNDPLYAVRIPTYHTAAMLWNFGDVISINNNSYTTGDIYMIAAANNGGPGFIGGTVDWADTLRAATDFSGATVILQTIDGTNIAFAIADANGAYSFSNLAYGTYKLYADFPGYTGNPTFVTLTPVTDSVTDAQVLLGPATITGIEETSAIDGISLYPNPTTDNATLVVEATKTAQLNLTVVNMMGQVVGSQTINAFAGKNIVQLSTDGLAQGVYTLVLRDAKGVAKSTKAD